MPSTLQREISQAKMDCKVERRIKSEENILALSGYTFGLDVIVYIGQLRYRENKKIEEIEIGTVIGIRLSSRSLLDDITFNYTRYEIYQKIIECIQLRCQ